MIIIIIITSPMQQQQQQQLQQSDTLCHNYIGISYSLTLQRVYVICMPIFR